MSTLRYREANRAKLREDRRRYIEANPEKVRENSRRQNARYKDTVYDHYGRACACCGTSEQLTIDHIAGGGAGHRKVTGWGTTFYRWLIKNGFPEGFQVLCRPCNGSKHARERCRLDHGHKVYGRQS